MQLGIALGSSVDFPPSTNEATQCQRKLGITILHIDFGCIVNPALGRSVRSGSNLTGHCSRMRKEFLVIRRQIC
jgi:hypothetical protein